MGNSIEELEGMKSFLVFGSNLVDEQPILFLRLRKAWRKYKSTVVEAVSATSHYGSQPNHVSEFAHLSVRYNEGSELGFINGLKAVAADDEAGINQASQLTGVSADLLESVYNSLVAGSTSILLGESISASKDFEAICSSVCDLAESTGNRGNVNLPVTTMNAQGAMDLGILPDSGPGYTSLEVPGLDAKSMLEATESGEIKFLWIIGSDPVSEFYDPELVKNGLENCEFTVVHAHSLNATAQMADVVLPVQTIAERDGSLTNVERRVQRFWQSFEIGPDVQPDWLGFQHISALLGCMMPYFSVRDISREIASSVPGYAGCSLRDLGDTGVRWTYSA